MWRRKITWNRPLRIWRSPKFVPICPAVVQSSHFQMESEQKEIVHNCHLTISNNYQPLSKQTYTILAHCCWVNIAIFFTHKFNFFQFTSVGQVPRFLPQVRRPQPGSNINPTKPFVSTHSNYQLSFLPINRCLETWCNWCLVMMIVMNGWNILSTLKSFCQPF